MTHAPKRVLILKRLTIVGGLWLVLWAGLSLPNLGALALVSLLGGAVLVIHWRSFAPLIILLLNPLSGWFVVGTTEWFRQRPAFHSKGYPGDEFFNLDVENRCYRSTGGCIVRGDEWTYQTPHNVGLWLMTKVLGWPLYTYHGPYPSKDTAIKLTDTALDTPPELFLKDRVLINANPISLRPGTAKDLVGDFGMFFFDVELPDTTRRVRATIVGNRCLVIRASFQESTEGESNPKPTEGIVLLDMKSGRAFARYVISGDLVRPVPRLLLGYP